MVEHSYCPETIQPHNYCPSTVFPLPSRLKQTSTHQLRHPAGDEGDGQNGHEPSEGQFLRGGEVGARVPVGGGGAAAGGAGVSAR